MYYLGIDIGKDFHVAGCINDKSEVVVKPFKFKSNSDGYKMFREQLNPYLSDAYKIKISLEATGLITVFTYLQTFSHPKRKVYLR
jgi:transposase